MEKVGKLSPKEKLLLVQEGLRRIRSVSGVKRVVKTALKVRESTLYPFSVDIKSHKWEGVVYQGRDSLMGTIFSLFDKEPVIYRGYPKIRYASSSQVLGKETSAQSKYDGTNLGVFSLPDGTIMGKTRMMPTWERNAFRTEGKTWKDLMEMVRGGATFRRMKRLIYDKNVIVYGELFGYLNPGEFVTYSVPIDYRGFDVVSMETLGFLRPSESMSLFFHYGIPRVETRWSGVLTEEEIRRIERLLESRLGIEEGWISKTWDDDIQDVIFCKLKAPSVKEKCWTRTGATIPTKIIKKAIKKGKDEGFFTEESLFKFVLDELREEVSEELLTETEGKIRLVLSRELRVPEVKVKEVRVALARMKREGLDLTDKRRVMSRLAIEFKELHPKVLFGLYTRILKERDSKPEIEKS